MGKGSSGHSRRNGGWPPCKAIPAALAVALAFTLWPLCALAAPGRLATGPSERASGAPQQHLAAQAAGKPYAAVLKKLSGANHRVYYKYVDVVGDKTVELVATVFPNEGMWSHDYIYTIKSSKPKLVFDRSSYGYWNSLTYRKEAKSIVYYGSGHGGDSYLYLKYSGGKYKAVAWKTRAWGSSSWSYSKVSGGTTTNISKAAFDKKVKPLLKGKARKVKFGGAKLIRNDANR